MSLTLSVFVFLLLYLEFGVGFAVKGAGVVNCTIISILLSDIVEAVELAPTIDFLCTLLFLFAWDLFESSVALVPVKAKIWFLFESVLFKTVLVKSAAFGITIWL